MSAIEQLNGPKVKKLSKALSQSEMKKVLGQAKYAELVLLMTSVDEEFEKSYLETANSKYNIFSIGKSKVNGDSHIPAHVQMVLDETEKIIEKADFKDSRIENVSVDWNCLLYTSPSPRDRQKSRMPSSA